MKLEEITIKKDVKEALLQILAEYNDRQVIIILSREIYNDLIQRSDVRAEIDPRGDYSTLNNIQYIYVNEEKNYYECIGRAVFKSICGRYVLKEFRGQMYKYPKWFDEDAEVIIFLRES